jgi:hypothetical protein
MSNGLFPGYFAQPVYHVVAGHSAGFVDYEQSVQGLACLLYDCRARGRGQGSGIRQTVWLSEQLSQSSAAVRHGGRPEAPVLS